jgi:hypothetical protein
MRTLGSWILIAALVPRLLGQVVVEKRSPGPVVMEEARRGVHKRLGILPDTYLRRANAGSGFRASRRGSSRLRGPASGSPTSCRRVPGSFSGRSDGPA